MRNATLTLMIVFIQTLLFGQNYNTTIGIKLNPGIATIYNPVDKNINFNRFSKSGGIELRQRIVKNRFYLETGIYLFDRGYKIKAVNDPGQRTYHEFQYYLTVPVSIIFKYKNFYFGTGPNFNYFLSRRLIREGELLSTDKPYKSDNIIFGAQFFAGYEFKLSDKLLLSFDGYISPTFKVRFLNYGLGIGFKYILTSNSKNQ